MDDSYDLNRFTVAQQEDYEQALRELTSGRKHTHWMWYIFPQIDGLAFSAMSRRYSIKCAAEARAYLQHAILGQRLLACAQAVLAHDGLSATEILGQPDDLKLRSCATLFASVSPPGSVFHRLLEKYYPTGPDEATVRLLQTNPDKREHGAG